MINSTELSGRKLVDRLDGSDGYLGSAPSAAAAVNTLELSSFRKEQLYADGTTGVAGKSVQQGPLWWGDD